MAFYIKKIVVANKEVYHKGDNQWSSVFEARKVYQTEADAIEERNRISGSVESD
jgi:hypothetical protein